MKNGASSPHGSFLVTCVGAYDDSGIGTGGFVCVHEGKATVIDKIDSTGLCEADGMYYRLARGVRSIVGYRADGLRFALKVPEARDVHDLMVRDGEFVCVSTGTNEVLWIDPLGAVKRRWKADGERDAWHLNCLCEVDGRLHLSAFGEFPTHRAWVGNCLGRGFILDLESGAKVVSELNGPHNPRFIGGEWVVCDSHACSLVFRRGTEPARKLQLGGFTRGLAFDDHYLYVGESADRKADVPAEHSSVAIIERSSLEVVKRIQIPFPEIYEIAMVPEPFARAMSSDIGAFQIDRAQERFAQLERQVEISRKEIESLKRRLDPLLRVEYLRGRLVQFKRRLVG
jgi:hypothetical protein